MAPACSVVSAVLVAWDYRPWYAPCGVVTQGLPRLPMEPPRSLSTCFEPGEDGRKPFLGYPEVLPLRSVALEIVWPASEPMEFLEPNETQRRS